MATGFLYDPKYLDHDTGFGHPERKDRLIATLAYLEQQAWFPTLVPVLSKQVEPQWIEKVHGGDYIKRAAAACHQGAPYLDVLDVSISQESYDIARLAVGGVLELADQLMTGTIHNGFGLIRPPGHHAEQNMAMGFCLFNNIAILARYLQHHHGLDKIVILDWDVHHGNGTQHTFEADPSVLYISLHQYPFYPGSGAASETGTGRGRKATLNYPMAAGSTDEDYQSAFMDSILPAINRFKPEAVLISAGFDAHRADPLAQINLSTAFYGWMSDRMMEVADAHANGRLISVLEGGYDLNALSHCVAQHLMVLSGAEVNETPI